MRRSRRLLEATGQRNGAIEMPLTGRKLDDDVKRLKVDINEVNNNDNSGNGNNNNNKSSNNKQARSKKEVTTSKSPTTSNKDIPLKERKKNKIERINDETSPKSDSTSELITSQSLIDMESDEKASTSHTCTEDTTTVGYDLTSIESESLAVLLDQGLTSSDAEKVDAVLSKTDMRIIMATLNDLSITQIVPLLKEIDYRCRNRKHFDGGWLRWLQCILSKHMAYLSTIGSLKTELATLFTWVKQRSESMKQLLEVNGKLMLVNEQINRRMCPQMFVTQQPILSFEDDGDVLTDDSMDLNDGDDSEKASMGSVEDWWDDEEVASENDDDAALSDDEERRKKLAIEDENMEEEEESSNGVFRLVID